eukprot:GHVT01091844.1.p2 GENE.GHVT01091844.1~~GHVT01091844.1.p2  ORF type:complete len:181 (-),score=21.29 GHVT01091844.1:719-1261(-)
MRLKNCPKRQSPTCHLTLLESLWSLPHSSSFSTAALAVSSPPVDSATVIEEGRAAVARLRQTYETSCRQSFRRLLSITAEFESTCLRAASGFFGALGGCIIFFLAYYAPYKSPFIPAVWSGYGAVSFLLALGFFNIVLNSEKAARARETPFPDDPPTNDSLVNSGEISVISGNKLVLSGV